MTMSIIIVTVTWDNQWRRRAERGITRRERSMISGGRVEADGGGGELGRGLGNGKEIAGHLHDGGESSLGLIHLYFYWLFYLFYFLLLIPYTNNTMNHSMHFTFKGACVPFEIGGRFGDCFHPIISCSH